MADGEEEDMEMIISTSPPPPPPPLVVRVGGKFEEGARGLGASDDEAIYYWRFVGEAEGSQVEVAYLFRDIDTACAYLEAVWALLPAENNAAQWSLVRTPLPPDIQVLPIQSKFVLDSGGGFLVNAASRFMSTLQRMGLASLYRDRSVAAAGLNMVSWEPTFNAAASEWPLNMHLVQGFLFAPPADGEEEDIPLFPRHWSWRRRGNMAQITPTDVDHVRCLALFRPTLERHMSLGRLPASLGVDAKPIIVERYCYEPVMTEENAMGPARCTLRLGNFPSDGKSRPTLSDVESWFNQFLGEKPSAELGKDEPGLDLKAYRTTLAVLALAFGDPLGNAWFVCMSRKAHLDYTGPPILCKKGDSEEDITRDSFTRELMAVMGYVHGGAPMFIDWGAERRRGRLFPAVRLRNSEHQLRLEFPYEGSNMWAASQWCAQLLNLVVVQSTSSTKVVDMAIDSRTPLLSLPPLFRPTTDRRHWLAGLEQASQVIADAFRHYFTGKQDRSEEQTVQDFITSGLGEQAILARPHLSRDVFFQENTWMGMVRVGTLDEALKQALSKRYPRATPPSSSSQAKGGYFSADVEAALLEGIEKLPGILCDGTSMQPHSETILSGGRARWAYVLPRDFPNANDTWFELLLKNGTRSPETTAPQPIDQKANNKPFEYSLIGSFFVESDFYHANKAIAMERAKKTAFFTMLNNLLDNNDLFPSRTPWFVPFFANRKTFKGYLKHMHRLMLHPVNALLHRALASGNEGILEMLLGWNRQNRDLLFVGVDADDALHSLKHLDSENDIVVASALFVAFITGQLARYEHQVPSPSSSSEKNKTLVEFMQNSAMAPYLLSPSGKPLLSNEWIMHEALRIGNLDLLELLLEKNDAYFKPLDFGMLQRDMQGVSRPLFLSEHLLLLERRYQESDIETHTRLGTIKSKLQLFFSDQEKSLVMHAPRTNLDASLNSAKVYYEVERATRHHHIGGRELFAWDATEDYKFPTVARGYLTAFTIAAIRVWTSKDPPLQGIKPTDEAFPLASLLGLAGRSWLLQSLNPRMAYLPDVLLVLKAHWRSFINSINLAKAAQAAIAPSALVLPTPEEAAAVMTPLYEDDTGMPSFGITDKDENSEDDPFSPNYELHLPPPPPQSLYAANIPQTAPLPPFRTEKQRQVRLFMEKVRRAADEGLNTEKKNQRNLPIYTIKQAAQLVKPGTSGFWLLPFYTSSLQDRRVSDLLLLHEKHLDDRIGNLTASISSIGALIASFGILERRMEQSQYGPRFKSMPFCFDYEAPEGRNRSPTTFWSDLSTGMAMLNPQSQLLMMFKTLARERMRLIAMHPSRSKDLILPVLKNILSGIIISTPGLSVTTAMDVVTKAVDAANKKVGGGDDIFRPVLARPPSPPSPSSTVNMIEDYDDVQILGSATTPLDRTKTFEDGIETAIKILRNEAPPSVPAPAQVAQNAMSQIRRLASYAFPVLAAGGYKLRRIADQGLKWVPDAFLGLVDAQLRTAIERTVMECGATYLMLLLVNEPLKYKEVVQQQPQPSSRPSESTRGKSATASKELVDLPPMQMLLKIVQPHSGHINQDAVQRLVEWLYAQKTSRNSEFGFTGELPSKLLRELNKTSELDFDTFSTLFGGVASQ